MAGRWTIAVACAGVLLLAGGDGAFGQAAVDADLPAPEDVLGYELGERFTDHAGVVRYVEELAERSPRVRVRPYGETVEGRPLLQVVIASVEHHERLERILERNRELADPNTPEARAREIAADNPAVVYFSYGVHGDESSSSEAALWTAWDLARGAESVAGVLDSTVVVIDPATNPDGRDRYVQWYRQARGAEPNPSPEAREHWTPWPGGRYSHYLFDLNRDWAWATQPETRARLATWDRWTPQVHVDFHEMSWRSSYFFFPPAEPINPLYPEYVLEWGRYIGEANAEAFDEQGWMYFTEESYDLFYPGYGDSWPSLLGAIGMTYEQAGGGRAGLAIDRPDGTRLTLRDRGRHHWVAGAATLRAVATRKTDLLLGFARFHRTVDEGLSDILLVPGADSSRVEALVRTLHRQGIRVERAPRPFTASARVHPGFAERREFPAGTYRVPVRQSRGRLAATLLQPETELNATYSYDVSAWSLPYAYGVEAHQTDDALRGVEWTPVEPSGSGSPAPVTTAGRSDAPGLGGSPSADEARPYGYLVPPRFGAWPALVRYLEEGGRARVMARPFTLEGRSWPAGTVVLPGRGADAAGDAVLRGSGLERHATAVESGRTSAGPDLGTADAYALELPRIAVLMGDGVSPTSYGAHWFFLERTLGAPFDALPIDRIEGSLDRYDVVVVPDTYGSALDASTLDRLEAWVRRGGTIVAVAGGARAVASLAGVEARAASAADDDEADVLDRALRGRRARELDRWESRIPGTVLSAQLDPAHPLAFGVGTGQVDDRRLFVLHRGGLIFEPDPSFETVAYFPEPARKISGVISDSNLDRLARGSWLATDRVERGRVVLFAGDPLFRHFWRGTFQPYVNAILLGPTM